MKLNKILSLKKNALFASRCYAKNIFYGTKAQKLLLEGMAKVNKAVSITLGPGGRNVIIQKSYGQPQITKDGVTVSRNIEFGDETNLGAQLIRSVAQKTNDLVGDGTTTATLLAYKIFNEGIKAVSSGSNPTILKRGIDLAVQEVLKSLKDQSKPIKTNQEIQQVGTISANGDTEIGNMIADAMAKVGREGVITCEDGKTLENQLEIVEGMKFDRGYISPYFITDVKAQTCLLENPYVLITDQKMGTVNEMMPLLQLVLNQPKPRPLLIIGEDIEGDALATMIVNRLRGGAKLCAVKAPGFGDHRKNNLQDIAILTGGTLITEELGMKIDKPELSWLGTCGKVVITKDDTLILNGGGKKHEIDERCNLLRDSLQKEGLSDYDKEKINERLAKLSGGVAILKIGGGSEVEVSEKKDRVIDALSATRAAVGEGIVAGGGVALTFASRTLETLEKKYEHQLDLYRGIHIVKNAIREPLKVIASNAGVSGEVVIEKVLEKGDKNFGFDASKLEYCNMIERGVIDPTKVVKTELIDAASVAALMCTTECMIVEEKKEKESVPQYPPQMGGMGMGGMGGMDMM